VKYIILYRIEREKDSLTDKLRSLEASQHEQEVLLQQQQTVNQSLQDIFDEEQKKVSVEKF